MPPAPHTEVGSVPRFSLGAGKKKSSLSLKRPHSVLEHITQDDNSNDGHEITVFGHVAEPEAQQVVAIQSVQNADWTDTRKRQKSSLPGATQPPKNSGNHGEIILQGLTQGGLTVVESAPDRQGRDFEAARVLMNADAPASSKPKTIEDEALDALRGLQQAWTIPAVAAQGDDHPPQTGTLVQEPVVDYNDTPIDGYGTALLRGYLQQGRTLEDYGYAANAGEESRARRRPAGLGLGAKESGMPDIEFGAWGKAAKRKGGEGYMPLARRSQKTGEILTEAELKGRLQKQSEEENKGAREGHLSKDHPQRHRHESPGSKHFDYREKHSSTRSEHGSGTLDRRKGEGHERERSRQRAHHRDRSRRTDRSEHESQRHSTRERSRDRGKHDR